MIPLEDVGASLVSPGIPIQDLYAESDAVQTAFRDLQPRLSLLERQVLDLYLSGQTTAQIASHLSISVKSADNAMTRIKKKIRDYIPY